MFNRDVYDYEVSIWTLQDGFITVLKPSETEIKGQIQDGKVLIKDDGTREISFSIPMYLYKGNEKFENPAWYNTTNGNILINLRKVKVIFNKKTEDEMVFEFLITKVTEEHQNGELICHVEGEGLAFHELGKIGYQISLSAEDYIDDWNNWVDIISKPLEDEVEEYPDEPLNNINYWCDKVFSYVTGWSYEIQMDWAGYYINRIDEDKVVTVARDTTKIYEDAIGILGPDKEKLRLVDVEESNVYNITQTIAELFGVFCRYEYSYDENYHIIGKKVIFYNNFLKESEGAYDLTYPYATSDITREIDSLNVVTKMYVRPLEDSDTATGLIDIIDVEENLTKENYILNFEYLHDIGTINEEQYKAISIYEQKIQELNEQLIPIEAQIVSFQNQLPVIEAQKTFSENAKNLDEQQRSSTQELLNSLTNGEGVISRSITNPVTLLLRQDTQALDIATYYVELSQHGIDASTIHLYKKYQLIHSENTSGNTENYIQASEEIQLGKFEYDDYGDLVKISNIVLNADLSEGPRLIYATYDYDPSIYYKRVLKTWENRLQKDTQNYEYNKQELQRIQTLLEAAVGQQGILIKEKQQVIADFNKLMGPALREGYWQPEDYTDYKDKYLNYYDFNPVTAEIKGSRENQFDSFIWDTIPFENEQSIQIQIGADQKTFFYPCIDLTQDNLPDIFAADSGNLQEHISQLSFLFYDYKIVNSSIDAIRQLRNFTIGSKCQYGFLKRANNIIIPVLILTGMETIPEEVDGATSQDPKVNVWNIIRSHTMYLGSIVAENGQLSLANWTQEVPSSAWINPTTTDTLVFPRIKISSLSLADNEKDLRLHYCGEVLEKYKDYSVLVRSDEDTENNIYLTSNYITVKPEVLLRGGINTVGKLNVSYAISNANLSIYLDALQISKENAYPKISYTITPNVFDKQFLKTLYARLSQIVHINDTDLHLKYVQGYISEIELDLDHAWNSTIEVKNYKNKFEDLFSSIVAQTEAMKKTSNTIYNVSKVVSLSGLTGTAMQSSLIKVDLNYAFNNGTLTINEQEGIWGTSDAGVVAFRGGGIFLANEKDSSGNWIWNTGIVPQGINANLITSGQLDTNRVMIYAGDLLSFQINSEGIFAYKSFFKDFNAASGVWHTDDRMVTYVNDALRKGKSMDEAQYVTLNADGLFLNVKKNALVLTESVDDNGDIVQKYISIGNSYYTYERDVKQDENGQDFPYYKIVEHYASDPAYAAKIAAIPAEFSRVAITWDGFTLRNYNGERVFYISADTGDIVMQGNIIAGNTNIINGNGDLISFDDYVDMSTQEIVQNLINEVQGHLMNISDKVDLLNEDFTNSLEYADELLNHIPINLLEIDNKINLLAADFQDSLDEGNRAIDQIQGNLQTINGRIDDLADDFEDSIADANAALDGVQVNISAINNKVDELNAEFDDELTNAQQALTTNINNQVQIINTRIDTLDSDYENSIEYLTGLIEATQNDIADIEAGTQLIADYYHGENVPLGYKVGDIWKPNTTLTYLATDDTYSADNNSTNRQNDWTLISNEEFISGAKIDINTNTGAIQVLANDVQITGSHSVKIGSGTGFAVASGGYINLVSTVNNNINAVEINGDGIALRSSGLIDIHSAADDSKSVIKVSASDGIKIGSTEKITFFTNDGITSTSSSAVELSKDRILFGVSADNDVTTAVDVDKDGIVITAQGIMNNNTVSTFSPLSTAGMKITNQLIGMSVTTTIGNNTSAKNLFWMDQDGVEIGSLSTSTTTGLKAVNIDEGSYALIKRAQGVEFGTTNNSGAAIVSIRTGQVLIAASNGQRQQSDDYYPISAFDIKANKLIYVNGRASNSVNAAKKFSDNGVATTTDTFNPRNSRLSGFIVDNEKMALSMTTQKTDSDDNGVIAKTLFWMDKDGIEMGSVGASNDARRDALLAGSYVFIKNANGVEIGAAPASTTTGAVASIRSTGRALFAARTKNDNNSVVATSVVDIQPEKVVITAGASNATIPKNFSNDDGTVAKTSNDFDPRDDSAISGIRIRQKDLGMAVATSSGKSLLWMDKDGLELGSVDSNVKANKDNLLAGTYVFIKHADGVEIGAAPATTDGTVASIRKTGRALFAARASSSTSVVDIQPTKVVITAGSNNATIPQNFAGDTGTVADTSNTFNPRGTNAISGIRIRQTDLGMAVVGDDNNPGKSLFWMDHDGLELGAVNSNSTALTTANLITGSYVFIKHKDGVEIGSGGSDNINGGIVSIQSKRVAIAVGSSSNASIIDMTDGNVIITSGARFSRQFADLSNTYDTFNPLTSPKSGVRITKENIGMAVVANNATSKNLIWMDSAGLEIGSVDTNGSASGATAINVAKGGFILVKRNTGVTIGGGTNSTAAQISLTTEGRFSASVATTNSDVNYAAFNLGKHSQITGTDSLFGFELETTGRMTIGKRIGVTGVYPFQITSENYKTTIIALRSWSDSPNNSTSARTSGYGVTIQAIQPTTEDNTTIYPKLIAIRRIASDVFTVDGRGYMEVEKIVVTNSAADNIVHTYPCASTLANGGENVTVSIRDTIKSYTTETINNINYVSTLTLASGVVLNFKHPTSGLAPSLDGVQVSASGSGANVNLTLSATDQTSRIINGFGTLHIYNPNGSPNINSSIIFDTTGNNSGTSENSAAIGLSEYWTVAQKATSVALVENLNTDNNAKKVKIRRIPNDGNSDTDWLATLVYDTANSKVLLTSNGTTSGIKYAEIGVSNSITYSGLAVRGTGSLSNFWNRQPFYTEITNKLNINGNEQATYIFDLAYHTTNNVAVNSESLVARTNKIVIYDAITQTDVVTWPLANYWDAAQSKVQLVSFNENTVSDNIQMSNGNSDNYIGRLHLTFSTSASNTYDETSNIVLTSNLNNNVHTIEENDKIYASINLGQYWQAAYNAGVASASITITPGLQTRSTSPSGVTENGWVDVIATDNSGNITMAQNPAGMWINLTSNSTYFRTANVNLTMNNVTYATLPLQNYWDAAQNKVSLLQNSFTVGATNADIVYLRKNNGLSESTTANNNDTQVARLHLVHSTSDNSSYDDTCNIILSSNINNADLANESSAGTIYARINLSGFWNIAQQSITFKSTSSTDTTYLTATGTVNGSTTVEAIIGSPSNLSRPISNFNGTERLVVRILKNGNLVSNSYVSLEKYWQAAQQKIKLDTITFGNLTNSNYITATAKSNITGNIGSLQYGIGYYQASSLSTTSAGFRTNTTSYTENDVILIKFNNEYVRDSCINLYDYWQAAKNSATVAFNAPTLANLNNTVQLVKNDTLANVTAKLCQDGNIVYLSEDGTSSSTKYAQLNITSSHSPTFTVTNVTQAGTHPHSFKITPKCGNTTGTAVEYRMGITANFSTGVNLISPKTSNFNRNDRVTLLQNTNIIRNVYFNLSTYWDAAQNNVGVSFSTGSSSTISVTKTTTGTIASAYLRFNNSALSSATYVQLASNSTNGTSGTVYGRISLSDYKTAVQNLIGVSSITVTQTTLNKQYNVTTTLSNPNNTSSSFKIYHETSSGYIASYYRENNVLSCYINSQENIIFNFNTMWRKYDTAFTAYRPSSASDTTKLRTRLQYTSTAKDQLLIKYSDECGILVGINSSTGELNVAIVGHLNSTTNNGTTITYGSTLVNNKIYVPSTSTATPVWIWNDANVSIS